MLTYTLTPTASIPDGLTFDATARSFEGMPTTPTAAVTLTYTVTDANGVATSQTLMVTVNAALSIADVEVGEGDGMATVAVRLEHDVPGGFMVDALTTDGTATAGADYIAVTGRTLTFDGHAGETRTFSIAITDDKVVELPETLTLSLDNLEDAGVLVNILPTGMLTITDNDTAALTLVSFDAGESTDNQTLNIIVTVTLVDAVPGSFTVVLSTAGGTAIADEDYTATSETLTFDGTAGEQKRVEIPTLFDDVPERDETVILSLSDLEGTQADVDISATATAIIRLSEGGIVGFGDTVMIADQVYVAGTPITPVILPEPIAADIDLNSMLTYSLTPSSAIPDGLSFDAASRTISGMPTMLTTTPATLTYTASNFTLVNDLPVLTANGFQSTSASLTFSVTVAETGVGSVTHYSDDTATTLITDLVSGGEIYSVVVFGANVSNENATDTTARPAIASTLGADAPMTFDIVAHDASLENGACRAQSATDTSRYTCLYSVEDSGANAAVNDPGRYTVSVFAATDEASDTTLDAYNADTGVIIGVRPEVLSVKYYSDSDFSATNELTVEAFSGSVIYAVIEFSENMEHINGLLNGLPDINVLGVDLLSNSEVTYAYEIVAHDTALGDSTVCRATSDTDTRAYLCRVDLAVLLDYVRVEVSQESRDLAGYMLAANYRSDNFTLVPHPPPMVSSIVHYADAAGMSPLMSGVASGREIFSLIQFTGLGLRENGLEIFYQLGSAARVPFGINFSVAPPPHGSCDQISTLTVNSLIRCRYSVGAAEEDEYQVIVGMGSMDALGNALETDYPSSSVTINALRFGAGVEIANQTYAVGQTVALTLPEVAGGADPLTYTLTPTASIPNGLTFDAAMRSIKGMPSMATTAALTYAVTDANGVAASLTFMVMVSVGPTLTMADVSVNEGAGIATVTVRLDKAVDGGFSVDASTMNGTATAGADYTAVTSHTLTFNGDVGETRTFSVTIVDDDLDEGAGETVMLSLGNLQSADVPVDSRDTATLTIIDDDGPLIVTSVGYFADEAMSLPITQAAIGTHVYIVVTFSENVRNDVSVFVSSTTPNRVIGRPGINVRYIDFSSGLPFVTTMPIIAHDTAFTDRIWSCRANSASASETNEYICQFFAVSGAVGEGALHVEVDVGNAHDSAGNTLAMDYKSPADFAVVATPAVPTVNPPITHYSDVARNTEINGMVTGGAIYSVIHFNGLPIDSPAIFYQIGAAPGAERVKFGVHTTGGTPENETCALLDGGDGTAAANQSFWCHYNPRSGDSGTYQVIVGTDTTDTAGQTLAADYTGDTGVTLAVTTGTATLSIADVDVNEGAGTATVSVTVDDAVTNGFKVDAMTADGTATATVDYTAVSGQTLTFTGDTDGETLSFTVPIIDDALYEGGTSGVPETVAVSLVNLRDNATNVDISSANATISITDNDYEVALTMEDISVSEDALTATVSVSLDTAVTGAFSVVASTADGTATATVDYTAVSGQILSFTGAVETRTFSVPIIDDNTEEFPETLTVSLSNLQVTTDTTTMAGTLRPASATITIMDDDISTGGINLNLRFSVTVNGKTYFYLDNNGNGIADVGDVVTHNTLNDLLNGGSDTEATQDGAHNGQDDERAVIIGDTAVILPTEDELTTLRSSQFNTAPVNWQNPLFREEYWTSNRDRSMFFLAYSFADGMATVEPDGNRNYVAFQVRTLPTFSAGIDSPRAYTVGQTVALTLPEASGGVGTLSYTLTRDDGSSALPAGLAFDPVARTISDMPSEPFGGPAGARLRYTATDATGAARDIVFVLRVAAAPALVTIGDQNYTANTAVNLTLPAATGGIAPLTYTLTPSASLPTDLVFDAAELTLKGRPPATPTAAVTLTYTVTDANGFTAEQTFALEVFSAPAIAANAVSDQVYTVNQPVALMLPDSAGAPPLTYTLTRIDGGTPVLPDGLTFDPVARTISDAPKATFGAGAGISLRYTVTDTNGVVASTDFTLLVNAAVTFDISAIPAPDSAYTYPLNTVITALTLPPATGGTGELTYTLTPTMSLPEGLTYAAAARTLAGMPTMVTTAAVALTYAVTDANDVAATLTFTVAVVDRPVVTITDSIATDTANIADDDVTFTFMFSEAVSGFDVSDISLDGGTASGTLNGTDPGATYTLAVTPDADTNAGTISVTVMENAATGETTSTGNVASTPATQDYDTLAPPVPTIDMVGDDYFINIMERDVGVSLGGGVESGASIDLCIGATDAACTGGTTATLAAVTTTWSYALTSSAINALGDGDTRVQATATDAAGNPGPTASRTFTVDTVAPNAPIINDLAGGNFLNAAERDAGFLVTGTVDEPDLSVSLCILGTLSDPCAALRTDLLAAATTTWSYRVTGTEATELGEGPEALIATATDAAGNPSMLTATDGFKVIIVDTVPPEFFVLGTPPPGTDSRSVAVNTPISVIVYDAVGHDGGFEDEGITYALSGPDADKFEFHDRLGTVKYKAVQTSPTSDSPHVIIITVFDRAGNSATLEVTISVLDAPAVNITSSTPIGDYANGVITFTISFSDAVTGFEPSDVSVAGNTGVVSITPTPVAATTYQTTDSFTLAVTPDTNNDGDLTVTVIVNAVTGAMTLTGNPAVAETRQYDTVAPIITGGATATAMFIVNDPVATEVYNADATDGGGMADDGITYSLSGTNAGQFTINPATGSVTYQTSPTDAAAHTIVITATDKGGNTDTITVTVTAVLSTNSDLSALTVTTTGGAAVPLSPAFATATSVYTANVIQAVARVIIATTKSRADAMTVRVTGIAADSSALAVTTSAVTGSTVTLEDGANTITITVTAADGTAMNIYTITLTRAPLLTFGAGTIDDQTYNIGETITALVLPVASGGLGTLSYTLTPEADIPTGLAFARASHTLSGTPSVLETRTLTYTVTDGATPPVSTELTFSVMIVRGVTVTPGSTADIRLDLDGNMAANDPEDGILTLPAGHTVTEAIIGVPPDTAIANPPAGALFSLTTDLTLNMALAAAATVCLPTTGVPAGREPVLYHYFTRAGQGAATWNEISRDTATREGYICGETLTFSPFAVGYMTGVMGAARLNEQILPRASLVMSASMLAAVAARVEAAADSAGGGGIGAGIGSIDGTGGTSGTDGNSIGTTPTLAYQFGGQSSLHGLFESHGKAMLEGQMEYEQLLDGASFVLPLSTTGDASADNADRRAGAIVFWGNSDYHSLSNNQNGLDWGGPVLSAHLGMDGRINQHLLTGVALSWNRARFDYHDEADGADTTGEYQYRNVSFNPYFGWLPVEGFKLWGTFGYGRGEIQIDEDGSDEYSSNTTQSSLAGGFSHRLFAVTGHPGIGLLSGSVITLNVKGDATLARVGVESSEEDIAAQDVDSQRLRLLLAGEVQYGLANGGALRPSLEIGMRYDGGDGETGSGLEVGSGLRYTNPIETLAVAGNVRTSLAQGYAEWGGGFTVQLSPRAGRGLSLSLHPVWGRTQSAAERLWRDGVDEVGNATGDTALQRSVDTEIGYGVGASALGKAGVLTPYTGINVTEGTRRLRMGGRFAGDDGLRLSLEGAQENSVDGVSHTVLLRGGVEF